MRNLQKDFWYPTFYAPVCSRKLDAGERGEALFGLFLKTIQIHPFFTRPVPAYQEARQVWLPKIKLAGENPASQ
jgi:hypothetical protein